MTLPSPLQNRYQYIKTIDLKELGIRKKILVYIVKNKQDQKSLIFYITQKSRFLQKDVDKIEEIQTIIVQNIKYNIMEKIIYIESPLCSKAKEKLFSLKWMLLS